MNNILELKTSSSTQSQENKSEYRLDYLGLGNLRKAYWNLPVEALYEEIIFRGEAQLAGMGPVIVNTGKHTARAANDKFIVEIID